MRKKEKILIFGAGGHGKVVLDILLETDVDVIGFLDDDRNKIDFKIRGIKVLGGFSYLENKKNIGIALGIGDNKIRENIFKAVKKIQLPLASAIHPKTVISKNVQLGQGVVVMAGVVINPGAILGDGVVVNTGATVDHDCYLKKFSQVWPGAHLAGSVRVGEFSYIGTGASIVNNIKIGKNVIIGAGAAVVSDIADDVVAVGVPAKVIKNNKK